MAAYFGVTLTNTLGKVIVLECLMPNFTIMFYHNVFLAVISDLWHLRLLCLAFGIAI